MTNAVAASKTKKNEMFDDISGARKAKDKIATGIIYLSIFIALAPLIWVLATVLIKGLPVLLSADWWMFDMTGQPNNTAGGGIVHAIIGTLAQVIITSLISVPIGVFTAVYLVEYANGNFLGRITCLLYTSPSPRDATLSRMPSSA